MKIMWLTTDSSLLERDENITIKAPLEAALMNYYGEKARLAVVFEKEHEGQEKVICGNVCYYPLEAKLTAVGLSVSYWEDSKVEILKVIDEFSPDIIHCFGSEWPYGAIAEETQVPVVIHMMGFLNIYHMTVDMVLNPLPQILPPPKRLAWLEKAKSQLKRRFLSAVRKPPKRVPNAVEQANAFELRVMKANRYFIGRTEWDKKIVRFYAPGAKYYHVPEALRDVIWKAAGTWRYHFQGKLRLLTVSSADYRKGNEIILRTALILQTVLGLDFEWRVAGSKEFFPFFEQRTQLKRQDLHINLLGRISAAQVRDELQEADFFIHPSIVDNSPHSICEAQLIGCPVIASNVGGVPQLVEDGKTGFLYPYNEPHALAFLLGELYQDRKRLTELSERESDMASCRHEPRRVADILFDTYERIIEDGKSEVVSRPAAPDGQGIDKPLAGRHRDNLAQDPAGAGRGQEL